MAHHNFELEKGKAWGPTSAWDIGVYTKRCYLGQYMTNLWA